MRIHSSSEILRPPEIVFPWIAEPEKAMKWQQNVKGGEIVIHKPEVIGTTFQEVIEEDGNSLEMHGVITNYVLNRLIEFHLESRMHVVDVSYSVDEMDSHTKLTIDARIKWKFPVNIISLFRGSQMQNELIKQMELEVMELKRLCENSQ